MFRSGRFTLLLPEDPQRFVYRRDTADQHMLVICNFTAEAAALQDIEIPEAAQLLLTNYLSPAAALRPYEAQIYIW